MKLLTKSLRSYFIFSSLLLAVTVPLFYFAVQAVLLNSVDKSLRQQLTDIRKTLPNIRNVAALQIWSSMDKDIRLSKTDHPFRDSIITTYLTESGENEIEPYREITAALPLNGEYYSLTITSSLVGNDELLGSIVAVEAVFLLFLLLGMILINRGITKKLWAPFYETLAAIRRYDLNRHQAVSFSKTNIDEFRELNEGVESLLKKNYAIYLAQKDFTGSAAHEMQTPLAIFQSQLELLMQTTPLTAEQAGLIQDLETNNQRIIRSNRSLLLLAKIENESFETSESVDISKIFEDMLQHYRPVLQAKQIRLEENFAVGASISANRALIEILAGNLLSNAVRHNVPRGILYIETGNGRIIIRNTGVAGALDSDRIYDRFYKSGPSQEGIGLGLAIVQRICAIERLHITYMFVEGQHRFEVGREL